MYSFDYFGLFRAELLCQFEEIMKFIREYYRRQAYQVTITHALVLRYYAIPLPWRRAEMTSSARQYI